MAENTLGRLGNRGARVSVLDWNEGIMICLPFLCAPLLVSSPAAVGNDVVDKCEVERLEVSRLSEPHLLTGIPHAAFNAQRLVIPQPEQQHVKVFDLAGRIVAIVGRSGGGPGEFRNPVRAGIISDSIWVYDSADRTVSLFELTGAFVRSYRPPLPGGVLLASVLSGDSYVGRLIRYRVPSGEVPREAILLARGQVASTIDTLAVFPIANRQVAFSGAGFRRTATQPWTAAPIAQAADDGSAFTVAFRPIASEPADARFRVVRYSPSGRVIWDKSFLYRPRPVTGVDVDALAREWSASFRTFLTDRNVTLSPADFSPLAIKSQLRVPRFAPPVEELLSSSDGSTWLKVVDRNHDRSSNVWLVLDSSGEALASCQFSPGVRLLAVAQGWAWAVERDGLDVPHLVKFAVVLRPPSA